MQKHAALTWAWPFSFTGLQCVIGLCCIQAFAVAERYALNREHNKLLKDDESPKVQLQQTCCMETTNYCWYLAACSANVQLERACDGIIDVEYHLSPRQQALC